jgi:hypothetical protein
MSVRACLALFLGAALLAGPGIGGSAGPRTLLITVLQTDNAALSRELLANTAVAAVNDRGYHSAIRTYGTDSARLPGSYQQLQVIAGDRAHFSVAYRSPEVRFLWAEDTRRGVLPNVGLVTQESSSGFYVQAELHGKRVLLQLDRYNGLSQPDYTGHGVQQNILTTVHGNLGDWLDAGGSLPLDLESTANRSYILQHNHEGQTRLLVKVELAP